MIVLLPCRSRPSGPPVAIHLALWESNYYRYPRSLRHEGGRLQFRQVYLRYQDAPCRNSTFEIDDSAIPENGPITYLATCPVGLLTGNTVTLSTTDPLCVIGYSCRQDYHFTVGFGQCFGQNWIRAVCGKSDTISWNIYDLMLERAPEHAQSMKKARSGAAYCQVYISQTRLPRSPCILQTSCVTWKSSRICGLKLEVFRNPGFGIASGEWTGFDVDGTDDPNRDWRGLMIRYYPSKQHSCDLLVDGVSMKFSFAPNDVKLGDYGQITDSEDFICEGNLFADLKSLSLKANIPPRQHIISEWSGYLRESGIVRAYYTPDCFTELYQPLGLSPPSNDEFKSLLVSFSTRLTNRYLVTRVIQCSADARMYGSSVTTRWCNIAKPFVWYRNKGAGAVVGRAVMAR
ncbi:hypothetical protein SCLCIDRAFT_758059 [Scleroderma citrinum Foug A]|uniref:Uncharacterized protein n=1 Tax=Scleroderma citrinum Foug A TaxID=1036808 RepID=A0A0C3D302_9AGAM|nr:hypothetical protein SCLCIDRAFT_758059 [Scleroderma citrinum Foug A]